jgi:L,D-transpeptidase-like protein
MRLRRFGLAAAAALAMLAFALPARANVMIIIDKAAQQMTVTVNGEDRYTWPVSTGRSGYDTPSGEFQPFRMERDHFSREWDAAPMPNSIFFTKIGHAIHGSFDVKHLGSPASHGCVRLAPQNAAILYALVKDEGVFNTIVRLKGEAPAPSPVVAKRGGDEREPVRRDSVRVTSTDNVDDGAVTPPPRKTRVTRSRDNDDTAEREPAVRDNARVNVRVTSTDNVDDGTVTPPPRKTRVTRSYSDNARPYYYREQPYYAPRPTYYGRGLFFPNGW